jgi:hypothetical protein
LAVPKISLSGFEAVFLQYSIPFTCRLADKPDELAKARKGMQEMMIGQSFVGARSLMKRKSHRAKLLKAAKTDSS